MSSEISTDSHVKVRLTPPITSDRTSDALQPWQLFTLAGLIGATVVVFVSTGQSPAGIVLLSLTIFAAAVVGLAAWRTFMPLTSRESATRPTMIGGRTRAALEREKTLVLRSIKELEFDRAMGKVSEKDFDEMSTRLRVRAAGLMRQLDAGTGYRDAIEKELVRRVGEPPAIVRATPVVGETPDTSATTCASCATPNDSDARFCKQCGARLGDGA